MANAPIPLLIAVPPWVSSKVNRLRAGVRRSSTMVAARSSTAIARHRHKVAPYRLNPAQGDRLRLRSPHETDGFVAHLSQLYRYSTTDTATLLLGGGDRGQLDAERLGLTKPDSVR